MRFLLITLVLVLVLLYLSAATQYEIQSCPGGKLNKLPQVRTFLKVAGHADAYEGLTIKWIQGKSPVLLIKTDAGKVVETIDITTYTTAKLHELMINKGLQRKFVGSKS